MYWLNFSNGIFTRRVNVFFLQAVSAAAVFSDRLCIVTDGAVAKNLSAEHVNNCCYRCGQGCDGGFPEGAWYFFARHGIVTGGGYHSGEVTDAEFSHVFSSSICRITSIGTFRSGRLRIQSIRKWKTIAVAQNLKYYCCHCLLVSFLRNSGFTS